MKKPVASHTSLLLLILCCFIGSPALALPSVTVMADSNVSVAIAEIARDYSRDKKTIVNTSFVTQKTQQSQISEGASADIVITPNQSWIADLKTQGLVDIYSQAPLVKDRLVLAGSAESTLHMKIVSGRHGLPAAALIKAMQGEQLFVVGNPETLPEGTYGKEALRNLGASDDLEPYTLYVKEPDQMFDMLTKQQGYGLFFYSTVFNRDDIRIIGMIPENTYTPIVYDGVVVAGENMDEARKFLQYLKSKEALAVFQANGFSAL